MSDAERFVATIKVERVGVHRSVSATGDRRVVSEALHITVKSATLDGLKAKVTAHVDLVDEEDV